MVWLVLWNLWMVNIIFLLICYFIDVSWFFLFVEFIYGYLCLGVWRFLVECSFLFYLCLCYILLFKYKFCGIIIFLWLIFFCNKMMCWRLLIDGLKICWVKMFCKCFVFLGMWGLVRLFLFNILWVILME